MRRHKMWPVLTSLLLLAGSGFAATGKVVKVLPQFVDLQGRNALSPSLYDRDAYQVQLRMHPEQRSGMRFNVRYKTSGGAYEKLVVRVELRGIAKGDLPKEMKIETEVRAAEGIFGRWVALPLEGQSYKDFGEVTAWRVTLWEGTTMIGEQKSFLW